MPDRIYLGEGAYVHLDGNNVVLTRDEYDVRGGGIPKTLAITLSPAAYQNLIAYVAGYRLGEAERKLREQNPR